MDAGLKYKKYIIRITSKSLAAAMALKRLKLIFLLIIR